MLNLAFTLPTVALLHKTSSNFSRLEILHILPKCKCLSNFARVKRCRHEYLKTCHVSLTIWSSRIKTYFICIFYVKLLRRILLYLKLAYSREQYARGDLFHRNCQLCILLKVGQATVVRELVEIQKNSNIGCEKIAKTSIRRRGLCCAIRCERSEAPELRHRPPLNMLMQGASRCRRNIATFNSQLARLIVNTFLLSFIQK